MSNQYLTVSALTKYIKRKIDTDQHLRDIWLKGEISNFKHHSRGHMYMTIKDNNASIKAVMFAGNNRYLRFKPEDGMSVLIRGEISVYEVQGQYQLYISKMEPDGVGSLYLAFEQLKEKLQKKGYFDPGHKKAIPLYPKHIGVITSPTGAAVRDIITTIKRRYPIVQITVIPVLVQGPYAKESIKNAIEQANEIGSFDTLIVGRGGGSIEELWSFNEEIVAEAIYHSKIPIISAVGHETDVTISDYVADLRAPTPTGAAELAVLSQIELKEKIIKLRQSLKREVTYSITESQNQLNRLKNSYAFRYPEQLLRQKEQQLDQFEERMERQMTTFLKEKSQSVKGLYQRMASNHPNRQLEIAAKNLEEKVKLHNKYMSIILENNYQHISKLMDKLSLLNPLEIMKRGFAIPFSDNGELIKSANQVQKDEKITVRLQDGNLNCQVLEKEESNSYE